MTDCSDRHYLGILATHDALYYSRPIEMPKTKRDGLANFVQMIINAAETGDAREAMLRAVDLLNDINSGIYDAAMVDDRARKIQDRAMQDMKEIHAAEIEAAYQRGWANALSEERMRIAKLLGILK